MTLQHSAGRPNLSGRRTFIWGPGAGFEEAGGMAPGWARHAVAPASQPLADMAARRRPLIYVYDLPAQFNTRMQQVLRR